MSKEEKYILIEECRSSGMSAKAWCAAKGINYRHYVRWASWYNTAAKTERTVPRWAALEVEKMQETETITNEIRLECGKWRICVGNGFNPGLLAEILRAVDTVC